METVGMMGTIVNAHTVKFERVIPGPIERVWDYIATPDGMSKWHRCATDFAIELRKGGPVSCRICPPPPGKTALPREAFANMPAMPAKGLIQNPRGLVSECLPPNILAYSFIDTECDVVSHVCFELKETGKDVLLTFTHSHLPADMMIQVAAGWHAHLDALAAVLRGEEPADFMTVFLEQVKRYSAAVGATLVLATSASPVLADSSNPGYATLNERRTQLLNNYDRIWKQADELKHDLNVLQHERSEDARRPENDLERQLVEKLNDLHQIELDIRDLDKVIR